MATSGNPVPENEEESENKVPIWILASQGIKLVINNNGKEAERLFLKYPDSLVMYAGYSFAVFMDALMTFEEEKLTLAISTLKEVERKCMNHTGWLKSITRVFLSSDTRPLSLSDSLETQIILADSQVCLAILTFLQQDFSGYIKGGWILRKAWKVYQNVYKDILQLYKERVGDLQLPDASNFSPNVNASEQDECDPFCDPQASHNGYITSTIPHSHSAILHKTSVTSIHPFTSPRNSKSSTEDSDTSSPNSLANNYSQSSNLSSPDRRNKISSFMKKSFSVNSALSDRSSGLNFWSHKFSPFNSSLFLSNLASNIPLFSSKETLTANRNIDKRSIIRLMGAVSFGYGLFQLGISLLPPSLLRLTNFFGFGASRQNGIACLMYARLGVDMRAPLATLSLLWYHTIVRPFYALDGSNVQAGVHASLQLLSESEKEYGQSSLFLFFRGRVSRLSSDIPTALKSFQQAVDNTTQREIKILANHEVGWCHLIQLDYCSARSTFLYLKSWSRWSKAFYTYLAAICTGACDDERDFEIFKDIKINLQNTPKGAQLDEFLLRRSKRCPSDPGILANMKPIYFRLLVYEMLYLWNALPSCNSENHRKIIEECQQIMDEDGSEPMRGISKLILGCTLNMQKKYPEGVDNLRECLAVRKTMAYNADDAHVSAFAQYELGSLLLKNTETKGEGVELLQQISQYNHYDFEHRLNVRVHSLLKTV